MYARSVCHLSSPPAKPRMTLCCQKKELLTVTLEGEGRSEGGYSHLAHILK